MWCGEYGVLGPNMTLIICLASGLGCWIPISLNFGIHGITAIKYWPEYILGELR